MRLSLPPLRFAGLLSLPLLVATLSACPPGWGNLSPPDGGDVAEPDGGLNEPNPNEPDGGPNEPDGGPNEPDGGPNEPDGGPNEPDGGPNEPDDGGPNEPDDGGPNEPDDGGPNEPDDGGPNEPDDGGPNEPDDGGPNEPEPCLQTPLETAEGWLCLSGTNGFGACDPVAESPIVAIEQRCPDAYVMTAAGGVHSVSNTGLDEVTNFSTCGGAPEIEGAFTDLLVQGDTFVGTTNVGFCALVESGGCACEIDNGAALITSATLVDDTRLVIARRDGTITETDVNTLEQFEVDLAATSATEMVSVTRPDGSYRLLMLRDNSDAHSCLLKEETSSSPSTQCLGLSTPTAPPHLLDVGEQEGSGRGVHLIERTPSAVGGLNLFSGVLDNATNTAFTSRNKRYAPLLLPNAFAAKGDVQSNGYRAAVGDRGGSVLVVEGTGDLTPAPNYPANSGELGTILMFTEGVDVNQAPNNLLWAISETGVWSLSRVDPTNPTSPPVFSAFSFTSLPVTAEMVRFHGHEVLVVGEINGSVHTFATNDGRTVTPIETRLAIADAGGGIPEAIIAVTDQGNANIVVFTTAGEVWHGYANTTTAPSFSSFSRFTVPMFADIEQTDQSRFLLSDRSAQPTNDNAKQHVFVTTRKEEDWSVLRYVVEIQSTGFLTYTPDNLTDLSVPGGSAQPVPFRFETSYLGTGFQELTWTTDDGSAAAVPFIGDNLTSGDLSTTRPTAGSIGGALAVRASPTCNFVFSTATPTYFSQTLEADGQLDVPLAKVPFNLIPTALARADNVVVAGGHGGHFYRIDLGNGCDSGTLSGLSRFDPSRPSAPIRALKWLDDTHLLMGDGNGAVQLLTIP